MLSKKALISAMFVCGTLSVSGQTSSNSPYTRYGLGDLSDQIFTNNAAMGGIGYALRNQMHVNPMNPASYTSVDSLSFMFDAGITLRCSNYQENGYKSHAKNSSFDYLVMQFRAHPRVGVSLGFTPYSNVGYNFAVTDPVQGNDDVTAMNNFTGEGGTQVIYAGVGYKILKNLSVGANFGYLYGKQTYQVVASFTNEADGTINYDRRKISSYKMDFGLQYTQPITKTQSVTVGLVYGLGHNVSATERKGIQVSDGAGYDVVDEVITKGGYGIPHSFGIGASYKYKHLTVGLDYSLQKWSEVEYAGEKGMYKDRNRVAFGTEYIPNTKGRSYFKRMAYRAGAFYTSPYVKTPEGDGPKQYGVSAGFGFPLKLYQRNTVLSITGQYSRLNPSVSSLMKENRFEIKLGLTFNEHWFMKWRVN